MTQETTTSLPTGRIDYAFRPFDGTYYIYSVASPSSLVTGIGVNTDLNATINAYIARTNYGNQLLQEDINRRNAEMAQINKVLSNPKSQEPAYAENLQRLKTKIADLQAYNAADKANIASANAAIASVQANAAGILAKLKSDQAAADAAAATAKPTPTTPETPATANPAAVGNTKPGLAGAASDDSGASQPNPAGSTGTPTSSPAGAAGASGTTPGTAKTTAGGSTGPNTPPQTASSTPADSNPTKSSTAWTYSKKSPQPVASASRPGKRLQNPLGELSSYTYQITMYMLTPDAYDAFVNTGRTKINAISNVTVDPTSSPSAPPKGGTYIVAQSGGINNTSIPRAPNFDYDYGIDDLQMRTLTGRKENAPTVVTEISFKIYEPYGFSFLTNLRKAGDTLYGSNQGNGNWGESGSNKLRQLFVLGIKFLGYDASGRIATPNLKLSDPTATGLLDPQNTATDGSLFEHFIDMQITSLKFKIDGRMVVYNIKGVQANVGKALNISRGTLKYQQNITEGTVGDAIEKLMVNINKEEQDAVSGDKPSKGVPNRFEVIWMPGTELIYQASMVSKADIDKSHWPGSAAKTSAESNDATATKTQTADNNTTQVSLAPNQPLLSCFQQIVKQSQYMETQLAAVYTTDPQADPKTKGDPKIKPSQQVHSLSWINVTPQVSSIKWDDKTKDWAYTIQYLITEYKTPINTSPMVNPNNNLYPGPVKRYDYWYTGKNAEILSYEQTMDNTYMQVVVGVGDSALSAGAAEPSKGAGNSGTQTDSPVQPGLQEATPRTGRTGYGMDAQNSFLTALFDAKAYLNAKVTIMGDPDWLPTDPVYNEQIIYDTYYGTSGYGVSIASSQVFVEIDFKEAVDYTSETGTLSINESIAFVPYPKTMTNKPKGVSYQVIQIDHTLSGGSFKQTLSLIGNSFGDEANQKAITAAVEAENTKQSEVEQQSSGPNPDNSDTTSSQSTGVTTDKPVTTNNVQGNAAPVTATTATPTVQTPNGPVADGNATGG